MENVFKEIQGGRYIPQSIDYPSMMKRHIRKHVSYMQPIYEAISNSLEVTEGENDIITIRTYLQPSTVEGKYLFLSIQIEDTGIGFNKENFERLQRLFDESKNCNNFGTGRIQFLHFFDKTDIYTVYEEDGKKHRKRIVLSAKFYNQHKAVIWESDQEEVPDETSMGTKLSFFYPLSDDDKNKYNELSSESLYDKVLLHYLSRFCIRKDNLQKICFETYINGVLNHSKNKVITGETIPPADMTEDFILSYQTYDKTKKDFVNTNKKEHFSVNSYLLPSNILKKNEVKMTSKDETVETTSLDMSFLDKTSRIGDKYMLCLVSSEYFTKRDGDERGKLLLKSKQDFIKSNDIFEMEESHIFVEDIRHEVVNKITTQYPQIKKVKEDFDLELERLVEFFALDRKTIDTIGYKYGETTESFLRRYKAYNAEISAKKDANMSMVLESLRTLDPVDINFKKKFNAKVREISKLIPEKNRAEISTYIASRKAAMTMLEYILKKQLEIQDGESRKRKDKERIIHELLFKQRTTNAMDSNLWILNEDFIHYKGVSEGRLRDIQINGELFLREDLTEEEEESLKAYHHDQLGKRTDVLLFPEEHKCIIIELKSATADVTKFLSQVVDYAGLIRQYAKDKFEITNFYAYLIGESFDFESILRRNPNFVESPYLDYVYIPDQKIYGGKYREKGTMYFEVLKYSSLLERAKIRNSVMIDKILKDYDCK